MKGCIDWLTIVFKSQHCDVEGEYFYHNNDVFHLLYDYKNKLETYFEDLDYEWLGVFKADATIYVPVKTASYFFVFFIYEYPDVLQFSLNEGKTDGTSEVLRSQFTNHQLREIQKIMNKLITFFKEYESYRIPYTTGILKFEFFTNFREFLKEVE
jgi:hypothetical protein